MVEMGSMDDCSICTGTAGRQHLAREMMFGTLEPFTYFECANCGAVQLASVPSDLARFYGDGYYSFGVSEWKKWSLPRRLLVAMALHRIPGARFFRSTLQGNLRPLAALARTGITRRMRLLDVGCGNGDLLFLLREAGFATEGIDKFIPNEAVDRWGTRVRCADLSETDGKWDLIMFHHSLEHMSDHRKVLEMVRERLAPNGLCMVRIPLAEEAWRIYGVNWIQLDAPRHLILHSRRSFQLTAHQSGFRIERFHCDSDGFQFWGSEMYKQGVAPSDRSYRRFSIARRMAFNAKATVLNLKGIGDQAVFILRAL